MFTPNYKNLQSSAKNIKVDRIPLYEHIIHTSVMEKVLNNDFCELINGNFTDKLEYFKNYCEFFRKLGYDTVSFEGCVTDILPNGGALGKHASGAIKTMDDFNKYPWEQVLDIYFSAYKEAFMALSKAMPDGMKAIGGVGNGIFEVVQDLVGFENLCYMKIDDEELYAMMFSKVGNLLIEIWSKFLKEFSDDFCVFRFGDDLGFKSETLLSTPDIKKYIIPEYKRIIEHIHTYDKPFLLHSCGAIFNVMDDIVNIVKIDAKHSNEDVISPFSDWIDRYGDKIGNFGGIDTDIICGENSDITEYVTNIYNVSRAKNGGVAIGSGNSIPDYTNIDAYMNMNDTLRKLRGN